MDIQEKSLVDNSQYGAIRHSSPGDGETHETYYNAAESMYGFTWTLDQCTSCIFTISSYGDGFGIPAYAELTKVEKRQVVDTPGRIDGNFGSKSSISFIMCVDKSDN
eukprot:49968_1